MKKGIVMEIDEGFLTLLTPDGEFLRARKQNQPYAIGEEIHFFPFENHKSLVANNSIKKLLSLKPLLAVLAVLLIFLGTFIPIYQDGKAYAYMSIDVKPSIELGVNKKMQVVELTSFNKDGKKIISQLHHWKKIDVSEITHTLLDEMKKEGYLNKNEQVIISTVHTKQTEKKAEEKLNENLNEIKETVDKNHLKLIVLSGTVKDREKAAQKGISTGKYKLQSSKNKINKEKLLEKEVPKSKKIAPKTILKPNLPSEPIKKQKEDKVVPDIPSKNKKKQMEDRSNRIHLPPGQVKKGKQKIKVQVKQNNNQIKKTSNEDGIWEYKHEWKHQDDWEHQNEWKHLKEWKHQNTWKHENDLERLNHRNKQLDLSKQKNESKQSVDSKSKEAHQHYNNH